MAISPGTDRFAPVAGIWQYRMVCRYSSVRPVSVLRMMTEIFFKTRRKPFLHRFPEHGG